MHIKKLISKSQYIILCVALPLCFSVQAQHVGGNPGPCPGGSAPVNGSCGSPSNAYPSRGAASPEVWRNRYGAIAATTDNSYVGVANEQSSMRAAKKLAVKKCAERTCRVVTEYVNGCGSVVYGQRNDSGVRIYKWGASQAESEAEAMKGCIGNNGTNCTVEFTGCSLPVRVQ